MNAKYIGLCTIVMALMVATALGQIPPNQNTDFIKGQWRLTKLTGLNVYNADDQKIGKIEEFLTGRSGKIETAVLSVGGFLGIGDRLISVSFGELTFVNEPLQSEAMPNAPPPTSPDGGTGPGTTRNSGIDTARDHPDHAVLKATKDQLTALPEFKYAK
jgi:hypothetical protein